MALIQHGPDGAFAAHGFWQFGHQSFPGGDANQRFAKCLRQTLGQRNRGAQSGKAARPNAYRNRIQRRRLQPRFGKNLFNQGRQYGGMTTWRIMPPGGQHRAIPQDRGGTTRQRPFKGEYQHLWNLPARP